MGERNLDTVLADGILQSMGDGVLILRADGRVVTANAAACAILGVEPPDGDFVLARLVENDSGNDAFLQVLLDSIYEGVTIHDRVVDFIRPDGGKIPLSVTASHLRGEDGGIQGAFIILTDMTEVQELRQSERGLNEELKKALRLADEKAGELKAALEQGQKFRLWLTAGILVLFVGLGVYHWFSGPSSSPPGVSSTAEGGGTLVVTPGELTRSISLSGTVAPLEEVIFTAPFQGVIKQMGFHYGEHVEKGQVLAELDASEMESKVREARTDYIKARKQMMEMEDWNKTLDVSRARRDVTQSRSLLDTARNKAAEDKELYDKGVIPKSEYDNTLQELQNKKMQYTASRETLASVLNKGDDEYREIARMELENAQSKLDAAEARLAGARILATVSGVAIRPSAQKGDDAPLAVGMVIAEGQPLVSIGSLAGLSIITEVDELDINSLAKDQPVEVSGDAFPGVTLKGRIDQISSQATDGQVPTFSATIQLTELPDDVGEKVRLGMTANMQVVTYSNPKALLVPLSAVITRGDGSFVRVLGEDGKVEERAVEPGHTTLRDVEILSGLREGETVLTGASS